MGECTFKLTIQPDFGDRRYLLDIPSNDVRFDTKDESDPGSIINGGSGVPVMRPEMKR